MNIADLPNEALAEVATFLVKPSRALFAVAMTNPALFSQKCLWESITLATTNQIILSLCSPNKDDDDDDEDDDGQEEEEEEEEEEVDGDSDSDSNYNSDGGDLYIGPEEFLASDYDDDYFFYDSYSLSDDNTYSIPDNDEDVDDADPDYTNFMESQDDDDEWATLDFDDVEESLAAKLSDDDIRGVLICIDGVNRLHTIRLDGCVNITGSGLDPLMGSTMLRTIDLSLTKLDSVSYWIEPTPKLSEESIIPILRSIVDAAGSSLRDVMLPHKFLQVLGHPNR